MEAPWVRLAGSSGNVRGKLLTARQALDDSLPVETEWSQCVDVPVCSSLGAAELVHVTSCAAMHTTTHAWLQLSTAPVATCSSGAGMSQVRGPGFCWMDVCRDAKPNRHRHSICCRRVRELQLSHNWSPCPPLARAGGHRRATLRSSSRYASPARSLSLA
jgi:hypothetical protein